MITRRRFWSMTVTMFVLFFLFQFPQVMKENGNEYDINEYAEEDPALNASDRWIALDEVREQGKQGGQKKQEKRQYTLLIGRANSKIGMIADQWCEYTKRRLIVRSNLDECPDDMEENAELILLEEDRVRDDKDLRKLIRLTEQGMSMVFCNLPEPSVIRESDEWRHLLGIKEVIDESAELIGVNLFSGFLLGGQAIYVPEDEQEREERQDLDLHVPWYLTDNGCFTYMVGMLEDTSVENEELPALIWRASADRGDGKVFAVNGSYMSDCTGIGILDAIVAQLNEYVIYPVVNAQNLAIANFPGLASENEEVMKRLYSRDQQAVYRDVLWPGLCSVIDEKGAHLTCFMSPQFDYEDENNPEGEQLILYLKQMREKGVEAGLSLDYVSGDLIDKLRRDEAFFENSGSSYKYVATYLPPDYSGGRWLFPWYTMLQQTQTVIRSYTVEEPVISYLTRDITGQSITSTGISHTYTEDIRMKSLETALGYSNIVMDMNQVAWPEQEEDRWEILSEKFSSNIDTFWRAFDMFDQTSATESDRRIRAFFALDYTCDRTGDEIHISIQNKTGDAWFILRTHGEEIISMQGGDYEMIETDAYLIRAEYENLSILCRRSDRLHYGLP